MYDHDKDCSFFAKRSLSCVWMKTAKPNLHGLHPFNPSFASCVFVCRLRMWWVGPASGSMQRKHLKLQGSCTGKTLKVQKVNLRMIRSWKMKWKIAQTSGHMNTVIIKAFYILAYCDNCLCRIVTGPQLRIPVINSTNLIKGLKCSAVIHVCVSCRNVRKTFGYVAVM